jgi:two-component system chemotaxis response regulator CheY
MSGANMKRRIMIVDDADFMRLVLRDVLEKGGYEIAAEAKDGKEAVERYSETHPDVVLLDVTMPVMDGLTALKEIKKSDPAAKVIMVSCMCQKAVVLETIRAGAFTFVAKPFEADSLLHVIETALAE